MIWPSRAPQSTLLSVPSLPFPGTLCLSHYFSTLPFLPTPPAINSEVSHSFPPPSFLPPPVITFFYAQPSSLDTPNNRSPKLLQPCCSIHHLDQLLGIPHFVWRSGGTDRRRDFAPSASSGFQKILGRKSHGIRYPYSHIQPVDSP